jgi:thioesterase domain-containing protein
MQVAVVEIEADSVVLTAPLEPNINQHATVFGGSAATLAVLAAWSLLHTKLVAEAIDCKLVVHRTSIQYDNPMNGSFSARASFADASAWPHFRQALLSRGMSRARVAAVLSCAGVQAARFQGQFVGLREPGV